MAWADSGKIRLAPLTIFCGNNSSGKSSLAQFLLMLKQTVESYDRQRVLHLGDKDSLVDLGTFHEMVFKHNEDNKIEFNFTFDAPETITINEILIPADFQLPSHSSLSAQPAGIFHEAEFRY